MAAIYMSVGIAVGLQNLSSLFRLVRPLLRVHLHLTQSHGVGLSPEVERGKAGVDLQTFHQRSQEAIPAHLSDAKTITEGPTLVPPPMLPPQSGSGPRSSALWNPLQECQ